jgi:hypothetical protein
MADSALGNTPVSCFSLGPLPSSEWDSPVSSSFFGKFVCCFPLRLDGPQCGVGLKVDQVANEEQASDTVASERNPLSLVAAWEKGGGTCKAVRGWYPWRSQVHFNSFIVYDGASKKQWVEENGLAG